MTSGAAGTVRGCATWVALALLAACSRSSPAPAGGADPTDGSATAAAPASPDAPCTVERIIDGDTLVCDDGRRVRLLLIDTPERSQAPFGARATEVLTALAPPGTHLQVELDVDPFDRYDRLLAYLRLPDGRSVNEEMLRAGMAVVAVYPPNVRQVDRYRAVADSARAARAGLWAVDAFACLPADHRAGRCP